MLNNKLPAATLDFSAAIVNLTQDLLANHETIISGQLVKSGTMIGAYIYEAQFAKNDEQYKDKLQAALDATNLTGYWLELLYRTGFFTDADFRDWAEDCDSIRGMIMSDMGFNEQ